MNLHALPLALSTLAVVAAAAASTLPSVAVAQAAPAAPPTFQVVDRIRIGGEPRWDYLFDDSEGGRLYVSHGSRTEVVDTAAGRVIGTLAPTEGVHGIAIARALGLGFVSDGQSGTVTVFELSTLRTTATIAVGANPDAILYDPATRRVMTFNGRSKDVSVIDAVAGKVVATVPLGGKPEFAQMGADHHAWFNLEESNEIAELDPATGTLLGKHSLAPCDSPSGLAVDPAGRFFPVCDNGWMMAVAPDGHVLGSAAIGAGPDGVAWLDGYAYSANGRDGTLSQVGETSPGHFATVATIPTARGARTIAADPRTHRLYLPTATLQPAAAGSRPAGVPGSFYVLVLEARR